MGSLNWVTGLMRVLDDWRQDHPATATLMHCYLCHIKAAGSGPWMQDSIVLLHRKIRVSNDVEKLGPLCAVGGNVRQT